MSTNPVGPMTMAELESSDPALAAQVRRARRTEDAERIKTLARRVQESAAAAQAATAAAATKPEPEPTWR